MSDITFNRIAKSYFYCLEGRQKAPFFPLNRNFVRYPGGYRLKKTERGLLYISQPIGFVTQNNVDALALKDELAAWLITEDWAPLEFDDEPGRRYTAVVENTLDDFNKFVKQRKGTINFVAKEALGLEKDFNLTTTFQAFTITGQTETPWTSRTVFTVPQAKYVIENNSGGRIVLNYSFIAGDTLDINYAERDVKLNGNDLAISIALETNWFDLKPGQVQLRASHNTDLTYTERFY